MEALIKELERITTGTCVNSAELAIKASLSDGKSHPLDKGWIRIGNFELALKDIFLEKFIAVKEVVK